MGYFMTPIISITLGYFFLNEKISSFKLISVLMMIFAILFLIIKFKNTSFFSFVNWFFLGNLWFNKKTN